MPRSAVVLLATLLAIVPPTPQALRHTSQEQVLISRYDAEARNRSVASAVVPASSQTPASAGRDGSGPAEDVRKAPTGPASLKQHQDLPTVIHHLRFPQAFQVCTKSLLRNMPRLKAPRIFCFTWVSPPEDNSKFRQNRIEQQLPELRKMYAECDGWAIFSNFDDPERGITKAHEGRSGKNPKSSVQFHSVYEKLVHDPSMAAYDWFLDLEPDHFVNIRQIRSKLANQSTELSGDRAAGGRRGAALPWGEHDAVYLAHMTVRAFNQGFLAEAKRQWNKVAGRLWTGCPIYTPPMVDDNCQGDVTMPKMAERLDGVLLKDAGALVDYFEMQNLGEGWDTEPVQIRTCCGFSDAKVDDELCP